jgi:kynureninase
VPGSGPYLLTHSVGCLPRSALHNAQTRFFDPWIHSGGDAWPAWLAEIGAFRNALAALLGGDASQYCPQPNVSAALAKLLPALPRPDVRKNVLIAAEDTFPSLGFVMRQAGALGFQLRLIPRAHDPAQFASWSDALSTDVFAALITHVHSNTSLVAPVAKIAEQCAERGVYSIIDIAQSAGIIPLAVDALGADAIVGSCVKWLCGGPGAGFLWARRTLIPELRPTDVGWFSHADPMEMDIHSFNYAPDALRFWGGTPSVLPYIVATAGLQLLGAIGIDTAWAHNRDLVQTFLDTAPSAVGKRLALEHSGGTLCIAPGEKLETVRAALGAVGARFDCRGPILRLSFHLCNTEEDARVVGRAWPR